MASALPSIKPSMDVKYLTSLAPGAALVESFIWAKARSDEAVIRPIRHNRNARMGGSSKDRSGDTARLFPIRLRTRPKPLANPRTIRQKRRPPGGGLGRSMISVAG